ncbi:isoprenoid synthase domain-containing protein [Trichoderma austrokoningii]
MMVVPEKSAAIIRDTVISFIDRVTDGGKLDKNAFTPTPFTELYEAVMADLKASSLRDHLELLNYKSHLEMSCYAAIDFCSTHPIEYQVIIAHATIFFFHSDDLLETKPEALRNLQLNICTGQPLGDPVLEWWFHEIMPRMWKVFHPTVASLSVTACYDFINGCGIEALTTGQDVKPQAPKYPDWLRFKTGLAPMYGFLILACATDPQLPTGGVEKYVHVVPDAVVFINIANDVLSFYKEMVAEETGNYIDQRAQMEQCDILTALQKVANEGIEAAERVFAGLADAPEYRANFAAFTKGYVHFHTATRRYRLQSLYEMA